MAVKVLIQFRPGYPQTSSAIPPDTVWVDITDRIDFTSLQWDQQATDKNTSLRFDVFTLLPLSSTRYDQYASYSAGSAPGDPAVDIDHRVDEAIHDTTFFIDITNRTEIKLIDGESVLFGGVVSNVDTERTGASHIIQRVEALDYTALLDEIVIRDYNAPNASDALGELATSTGLTSQVITGGSALIAGPYTFRVIGATEGGDIVKIFTHITQYISPSDVSPADITVTPLRTIELNWEPVPGADEFIIYAKQGIGTANLYRQGSTASTTYTYQLSTTPVTNTATSPENLIQKGSIDVDIISGSADPENTNYLGIFSAIDPDLNPGINNVDYVKPSKVLYDGSPDPDKSYRFSPTLETGLILRSGFGGKTIKQALKTITDKTGAIFWVDANKNLHYANKKAQELVQNPRFDSSSSNWTLGVNHTIYPNGGPFGHGNILLASESSSTNETQSEPIPITSNTVYMARARGWADGSFEDNWDCEIQYYSDEPAETFAGSPSKLYRTVAFDGDDGERWSKTWAIAKSGVSAVSARLIAKRKAGATAQCAWTDFSLIEVTGEFGFSDRPSDVAYALPLKGFETPKAPREASGVANRLLVYGVYKDPTNTNELEAVEYNAGLYLTKAQGGSLAANTYWVRVVANTPDGKVFVRYAMETITDADVAAPTPVRTLSANWASVPSATSYDIYVGSGRMSMRLKQAAHNSTSYTVSSVPGNGAQISGEPDVYYYKVYDFAPGLWESGGKVIEATLNDQLVDSEEKAQTRALSFWEEKGIAMRTWEFDHLEEAPRVGTVIPFIWEADDVAEPLIVKGVKGKFLGDRIYWTTTLGSDPSLIKKGVTQIFSDLKQATLRLNDTIPPQRPQSLSVAAPSGSLIQTPDGVSRATVVADWTPSPEDDFSHYVVQYGYDSNFANTQSINVNQTTNVQSRSTGEKAKVTHSFQAEPGKRLYYRVAAKDRTGNQSDFTDSVIDLPADTTAPDAPTNVQVTASLKSMAITWAFGFYDPSLPTVNTNNTDFSRFKIYRKEYNAGTNPNEPWVKIAETSANVYIDTNFTNYTNQYQYKVSTVDRTGNESTATQETSPSWRSPNKITGTVDIEDATITSAQIDSLTADLITAGTLNISTGMSVVSDGTATLPQFEVDKDGVTIRDDEGNVVLQVNGNTSTLDADFIDVSNLAATEITVGSGEGVVRVGNNVSPEFHGIWAGSSDPTTAEFTVNTSGVMTATSASITGTVTANSGAIGGWAIDSNKIYQALAISPNISGIYTGSSASNGLTFFAGAATSTGTSAAFTVTNAGAVTATNANITGTVSTNNITATGGIVGGWTLSSTSLTSGTGASTVGIATSGGYAFYAGDSTPASAEFRVTPGGALTATDATITGSVTATSGAIGGWSIGATTISSSSGNVVLNNNGVITAGAASPNQAHMSGNGFWAGAGAADYSTAPFRVSTTGGVTAKNISVIGGTVSVGDAPVAISYLSRNASGVVTIKTSAAVNATVNQSVTIDVTSSPWATNADFNGTFTILSITASSPYTLTYQGATSSAVTEIAATGFVYTGAKISGESASGTWFTVDSGFALKNPANVSQNIITATASDVTINADFIKAGTVTLGNLGSNAISSTNFSVSNTGTITAKDGTIGGWTLGTSSITNLGSSKYVGLLDAATDTDVAIFAGATNAAGSGAVFTVKNDGTVSATSGTIGGWTLGSSSLTAGTGSTSVGVSTGTTAFYAGNATPGSAPFRVTNAGVLTATGVDITGTITANSGSFTGTISTSNITATGGTVGGWTLASSGSTRFYAGTSSAYTGLVASSTSTSIAIFAGADDSSGLNADFFVRNDGSISATSGAVGGWTLSSTSLTAGSLGTTVGIDSGGTNPAFYAGSATPGSAPFRVTKDGVLNATGATISGAITATSGSFTGDITTNNISATAGTVGGWTLTSSGSTRLYAGTGTAFTGLIANSASSSAVTIFAGATDNAGTSPLFSVTNAGYLTASSGLIGGFTLNSTSLTAGSSTTAVGLAPGTYPFFAGNSTASSAPFRVSSAGAVTASNITATGGYIGGWLLGATSLTAGSSSTTVGIDSGGTNPAFYAGSATPGSAPFRVTQAGVLNATGATITGDITTNNISATAGTIGGWTLTSSGSTRLYSGTSSAYTGLIASSSSGAVTIFAGASDNAGTSPLFSVTNSGSLNASDVTLSNSGISSVGASTVGAINLKPVAVNGTNVAGSVITLWSNPNASTSATLHYTEYTISAISGSTSIGATKTVTTTTNHDFGVGQYVSITGVSCTAPNYWGKIDSQTEAVRVVTVPSATTFTFTSPYALGTAILSSPKVQGYKTLTIVAPGGLFVADQVGSTLSPGMMGVGSIALGKTFENVGGDTTTLGVDGLPKPADGEIVWVTGTSPTYTGGANIYSSDGATNLNTSGDFVIGGNLTVNGSYGLVANDIPTLTLGTDTAGNYVAGLTAGTGVTISGTAGEGWSPTVAIGQSVSTAATPTFAGITTTGNSSIGNGTTDQIKFVNLLQTSTITNSYSAIRLYNSVATVPWRAFVDSSSERFKTNIVYEDSSDAILDLRSVSYHDKLEFEEKGDEAPRQRGFLAEEVAANSDGETFVVFNLEGQADAIQYDRLVVPLHSAMRKLRDRINELEARLAALENA
jgi:hypothetical protein